MCYRVLRGVLALTARPAAARAVPRTRPSPRTRRNAISATRRCARSKAAAAFPATGMALSAGPAGRPKTGEQRPAIPRSVPFCDTRVAPRYSNGPTG